MLFVEEGYQESGIGNYVGNRLLNCGYRGIYKNVGIKSGFLKAAKPQEILSDCGLDAQSIAEQLKAMKELTL